MDWRIGTRTTLERQYLFARAYRTVNNVCDYQGGGRCPALHRRVSRYRVPVTIRSNIQKKSANAIFFPKNGPAVLALLCTAAYQEPQQQNVSVVLRANHFTHALQSPPPPPPPPRSPGRPPAVFPCPDTPRGDPTRSARGSSYPPRPRPIAQGSRQGRSIS